MGREKIGHLTGFLMYLGMFVFIIVQSCSEKPETSKKAYPETYCKLTQEQLEELVEIKNDSL